ncbi:MAG: DUF2206 domain-containing protein [Flavobacterium sp.]|uniref:DUF2206 domain-containing protein n=1 Tax=Flavobacterium sp. TaxID=239 RepID=UPI0026124FFB|nr:DUF2206 domain-containing protein [Flavobacterium sp.]MDD5149115.1 DUF2206 domain-containing protein [Flavobacterium sp.]
MNENIYPWALWMIGLSLLLMFSMRSWYVSGGDIITENQLFQLTSIKYIWNLANFKDAYNSCLSITILPNVLNNFLKIQGDYIFKIFNQIIYSIFPIIIFLISKKYLIDKILTFLSVFFVIIFEGFIESSPMHIRQEIAFIFFSLMILILLTNDLFFNSIKILFILFGFSMIVSHYSTSYIAITFFILTYISSFIWRKFKNMEIGKGKIKKIRSRFCLTIELTLLILLFGFLWLSQITQTSSGLVNVAESSIKQINNIFQEENNMGQISSYNDLLQNYTYELNIKYNTLYKIKLYDNIKIKEYYSRAINPEILSYKISIGFINIFGFYKILKILIQILIIMGGFYFLFFKIKKNNIERLIMVIISTLFLVLIKLLPFVNSTYDPMRFFYQMIILLSSFLILGFLFFLKFISKNRIYFVITTIFIVYFLYSSGFLAQIIGGQAPNLQLNNIGDKYNMWYTYNEKNTAINWFILNENNKDILFVNNYDMRRFQVSSTSLNYRVFQGILPSTVSPGAYVYSDKTNILKNKAYLFPNNLVVPYNFPTEFLNENKNKIYNNEGSEIFK